MNDLTDVYVKLVNLNYQGFNEVLGGWEIVPVRFHEDNRLFNYAENFTIRADDNQTLKLAGIQGKKIVFFLKERPYHPKLHYPNIHEKYVYAYEKWELEFDVFGRILDKPFEKERFLVTIDSTKIESFADSETESSLTIDIKDDIIHLEKEKIKEG